MPISRSLSLEKRKLSEISLHCHSLSLVVTRYHSLSLVLPLADTRCHSLYNLLSLDVSLVCFFINDHLFTSSHSQMIFKIGVVKNLQFYFPVKFAQFSRTSFFTEHLRWLLLSFLKRKGKNEKMYSHKHIYRKTPVARLWVYCFTKKRLHFRCFCEICEVLQNFNFTEAGWLLPNSSKIAGILLALRAINQLSHSLLYV